MKVVDSNVLLYATNSQAEHHVAAREWMDRELSGSGTVGFSWNSLLSFLRLSTKVGLFPTPLTVEEALTQVRAWLACPNAILVEPSDRHLDILAGLLTQVGTGGNLTGDAHLAALAVEHHGEVVSWDNDFDRFPGVRWRRPG